MNGSLAPFLAVLALATQAQVSIDRPLQFTGAAVERGVEGHAAPLSADAAMRVDGALLGAAHWATASQTDALITLSPQPALESYRDGLLFRFTAPATAHGALLLQAGTGAQLPLLRPDGLPPTHGQILEGRVCEVLLASDRWILLSAAERGCPPGTLSVQEGLCIEIQDTPGLRFYQAGDRCMALGGKLCTWDEYYLACALFQDQLQGMFNNWEWIDDGANHDHTADYVALNDCFGHQSATILQTATGDTRCCFRPR
ncbi:MAG: hypothetical protein KF905_15670 [Flavobacteriales bacterium]|nr:hypothetical protein [Flavobacteriales bacterium]